MKLTIFSLLALTIIFAFAGVQPISSYKDNIITKWDIYWAEQKVRTEERLAQEKIEEKKRIEEKISQIEVVIKSAQIVTHAGTEQVSVGNKIIIMCRCYCCHPLPTSLSMRP